MEHARPPTELILEGGPTCRADAWRKWQKQFMIFMKASGVHKEPADVQASLLINLIGSEGYDIYTTFKFIKDEDRDDISKIIVKFNEHFKTKPNTTMARFKFFTRNQEKGENIGEYVTALRLLSQYCEFEHLEDGLIKDRIVCGIYEVSLRDRLLRTDELTLDKAVKICEANEISSEDNKQIEVTKVSTNGDVRSSSVAVDAVFSASALRGSGEGQRGRASATGSYQQSQLRRRTNHVNNAAEICYNCGYPRCDNDARCPARFAKCYVCNKMGHFRKMCSMKSKLRGNSKKVYELYEDDDDERLYFISTLEQVYTIHSKDFRHSKWCESLFFARNNMQICFKLDTGSDFNVLSMKSFINLGCDAQEIEPKQIRAQSFCGNFLSIAGTCILKWIFKGKTFNIKFVIANFNCQNVLGKYTCEEIGVVKRVMSLSMNDYDDLFHGLGKLPGKYKIMLEKDASPTVCPVRKIPIGVRDKLLDSLNKMEEMGVIRKVTHPTPWVNAIVLAAKKDGDLRICLDPRPLNRVIRRSHYPLPTLMEIATKFEGARIFSKLDARSGFWMVEIDDESADLCTFGTPFGRYQYLRLPYGISSASEIFHAKVRQLLEDLEGVDSFIDDVIVWGRTVEEHDSRLRSLLDRAREIGLRFNREKCEFRVDKVTYLGHTFSYKGMQVDESKLKAINDMPTPSDRLSLERFLGMVNYLSKFISNFSELSAPLRCLLKKNAEWSWDAVHDAAVLRLKEALCSAPVLALYSNEKPVLISVDASSIALGAVLLQDSRPVEFASLTLTDTQQRYAQIEKEMLAIVFALERFHQYTFGRLDVIVETDHKPLEALFKKALNTVPARLQRMMLRVQGYDFKVIYKPGKYMFLADTLSRAALPDLLHDNVSKELEEQSCFLIENIARFSVDRLCSIRDATATDEECQVLIKYIKDGWPQHKRDVNPTAKAHWDHRDLLEYVDGILFKSDLVYIPRLLRSEMVQRVHEGHLGIDRCKRRARDVMFWCGMSRDVEVAVRRCRVCAEYAARPPREPMIPHAVPRLPWTKVGSDICEYAQKYYLILVDYFSNYIEVNVLNSISSNAVIGALKEQFARHGIPEELVTDNGPAYSSKEFSAFCREWEFVHTTSSPHYAQSNGLSERAVRTIKNIIKKSTCERADFYLGLLNLRATPRDSIGSPSQLLMGRRLRTKLPVHDNKLQSERDNNSDYTNIIKKKLRSKEYYDLHSRPLADLQPGDEVFVADGANKKLMYVTSKSKQPRSYFLTNDTGKVYRRNRRHIKKLVSNASGASSSASCREKEMDDRHFDISEQGNQGQYMSAEENDCDHPERQAKTVERVRREALSKARVRIGSMFRK